MEINIPEKKQRKAKVTTKQIRAIKITQDLMASGKEVIMKNVMREAGYAQSVLDQPQVLTESMTWKEAFGSIDWGRQLKQVEDLADTRFNLDKDNCLRAKDMLFKIGDKFPKTDSKVINFFGSLEGLRKKENDNVIGQGNTTEENKFLTSPGTEESPGVSE
jgi:hypothetical protein